MCERKLVIKSNMTESAKEQKLGGGGKVVVTLKSQSPAPLLSAAPFPNLLDPIRGYIRLALEVPMRLLPD